MKKTTQKFKLISSLCDLQIIGKTERIIKDVFFQLEKTAKFYHVQLQKRATKTDKNIETFISELAVYNTGMKQILPELHSFLKTLK